MPELPETETIARDLDREIRGRVIVAVVVRRPDVLRGVDAAALAARTVDARIERCWRRAKLVVIDLDRGDRIVVQPRFTGALLLSRGPLPAEEAPYSTLHFTLDDGRDLHYRDIRRLGTVALMDEPAFAAYDAGLGIEPLDPGFSAEHLSGLLRGSRQPVKKVLMDQRVLVGIGNIYANEACWRAGIDPSRSARAVDVAEAVRLRDAIRDVLTESIAARGTSFRDYRDASGGRGDFERSLAAYGRGGEPCLRCGARLVETHAIDGRTTVLCAGCQK
ncbi:MAG: bifunctional DNA-formamidopyrimidine glycosylase/DNA-(apurinic or apyrimidinic site) lyase [Gemmatimonadaceae bacterium]|nr:bifunctional DNA-formamidopyrimidine glycosylase/DNA-(apurinic or apyrimidinic site) lyase [Gemmatimonadaceae bacterium]NUO95140.1 bifunctional DNA-formamidopyrimidine glycosylase/DNA-(apurinic or apyrimidinic site) lyase [Gemmatimonadaceae bacterium]NUP57530.1 bifunctional DNA-formamidopyrimidine glycosylase/DNA-(apurinic or apyrimidinic site) lyase [Gemmatimonadaceae bacterium]NUP72267.1 bifunctional DNA-formamidopyrimidine glycosylase/DNA-(apurinic or apyrimidinic site) lyase [Gemmatimonad